MRIFKTLSLAIGFMLLPTLQAQDPIGQPGKSSGQPIPLRNVYFGEQHLHTQASTDAFMIDCRDTWEDAYNYGLGKETPLKPGGEVTKAKTPLHFVGITDHAVYLGLLPRMC